MPELPEVQTVINYLKTKIINQKIISIEVLAEKMVKNISITDFKRILINSTILNIKRVGKYLVFFLDNNYVIVSHLRMEGKYLVSNKYNIINDKHIHMIIELTNYNLYYHDTRKFGTFTVYDSSTFLQSKELVKIAIDPLNILFDGKYLFSKICNSKKPIKSLLLNQSIVSGIGNIYACEILFSSKISPYRIGNSITISECNVMSDEAKRILNLSIKHNGSTVSSFLFDGNYIGSFQNYLNVYGRKNKKCISCESLISKNYINKRGTFYCENCQK